MYAYRGFGLAVYSLQKLYGRSITVVVKSNKTVDMFTGAISYGATTAYEIPKAVVAPPELLRKVLNPTASYGIAEVQSDYVVILAAQDIPTVMVASLDWVFEIDGNTYKVVSARPIKIGSPAVFSVARVEEIQ